MSGSKAAPPPAAPSSDPVAAVDAIREHFPALRRRHGGFPVAYLDGPGGTQVPVSYTHLTLPTNREV